MAYTYLLITVKSPEIIKSLKCFEKNRIGRKSVSFQVYGGGL